jgi:hypothetical protein
MEEWHHFRFLFDFNNCFFWSYVLFNSITTVLITLLVWCLHVKNVVFLFPAWHGEMAWFQVFILFGNCSYISFGLIFTLKKCCAPFHAFAWRSYAVFIWLILELFLSYCHT